MKKYIKIGFISTSETEPGIWSKSVVEKNYFADIIRNSMNINSSGNFNDSLQLSNSASIIANPYIKNNLQHIKYVIINGSKWSITSISEEFPRITINIGGLYNG